MAKAKRQIEEDLKLIDIVIEILDARVPYSSQNPDVGKLLNNKKKIIVLNKSDLADESQTKEWKAYFENNGTPCVIVNSNTGLGIREVLKKVEEMMQDELKRQQEKGRVRKNIRLLVMGIPNVGKSSFINRIAKRSTAIVGNKPGVTKQKQWIRIQNNIELLDTPGILWPKFESKEIALHLAFTGTIKAEIIDECELSYYLIMFLYNNVKKNLQERYNITDEELKTIFEEKIEESEKYILLLELIAKKRGAIISGGMADQLKVARLLLEDFRTGKFGKITLEKSKFGGK